jgi:S-adenosylmethionine synthetase
MKKDFMFTSESVTAGHPDKLCDQISDALLDHFLEQDPCARIIAECAVSTSILFIAARFASPEATVDFPMIARKVIQEVGYDSSEFNSKTCSILTSLKELPLDESGCFDEESLSEEEIEAIPAKNQVNVFGHACTHTPDLIPMPIWLAHKFSRRLASVSRDKTLPYLYLDGKTQVGVEFRNRRPHRIHSITMTASQKEAREPSIEQIRRDILEAVIQPVLEDVEIKADPDTKIFVNPDGPFILGGPSTHSGLTGRKNAIDTYGEFSRHSGAALSGKDPLRIDRVGAYAARYAAKNIVAAGLADECELQVSYAIGRSRPVSIQVETFGTGIIPDKDIEELIEELFEFRIAGIVKQFRLKRLPGETKGGFYRKLAAYGHVGRSDLELPWEMTNMADILRHNVPVLGSG